MAPTSSPATNSRNWRNKPAPRLSITRRSITFGSVDTTAQNLFRNCASDTTMYYHAPNNATLAGVFRSIAGELANLRIVE